MRSNRRFGRMILLAVFLMIPLTSLTAHAEYPDGGKPLPCPSMWEQVVGPDRVVERESVLRQMPALHKRLADTLRNQGLWTDPYALAKEIHTANKPFSKKFDLLLDEDSEFSIDNYIYVLGMRERLAELREPTLEEELKLNQAYYVLSTFPNKSMRRLLEPFTGAVANSQLQERILVWEELGRHARNALYRSSVRLSRRPDLMGERAGDLLWRIDEETGADEALYMCAKKKSIERWPDSKRKMQFIMEAVHKGYYSAAEQVWKNLNDKDPWSTLYKEAEAVRAKAKQLESLASRSDYQSGFTRGLILFEFGRLDEAEAQFRALIDLDNKKPEAWTGLAKTLYTRDAPDFTAARNVMNDAEKVVKKKSAQYMEVRLGLETSAMYHDMSVAPQNSKLVIQRGLAKLTGLNKEYRVYDPNRAELVSITLDFLNRMISNPDKGPCGPPLVQYLKRVRGVLKADPNDYDALVMEANLTVAVNLRLSPKVLTRPLPKNLMGPDRDRLRIIRARFLLACALYGKNWNLLEQVLYQLNNLEYQREDDDLMAEAWMIRGHVWAIRGMQHKWGKSDQLDRALEFYEKALEHIRLDDRPVVLNNMLFMQIKARPPYEVARTADWLKRLSLDGETRTLLLPNLSWLIEAPDPETIVSRIEAKPGTRAYAVGMVLAGQRALEAERYQEMKKLWRKAYHGVRLCSSFPLCRNCYMPGPVFVNGEFNWSIEYSAGKGLTLPMEITPEFWLMLPGGAGDGPGGWPSLSQIRYSLR